MHNLAGVYRNKGELDTALDMYQDAVEKVQVVMGEMRTDHEKREIKLAREHEAERGRWEKDVAAVMGGHEAERGRWEKDVTDTREEVS